MFSILHQEKTSLRDERGGTVFRCLFLCDGEADIPALPVTTAPGSGAVLAAGGGFYILDHSGVWQRADDARSLIGGGLWNR